MPPREVFLSHASADHEMAQRLADALAAHGVPVFYSPSKILAGQQWHDEIGAALERCDWFLLLISTSAVSSMWVKRELTHALIEPRYADRIVPLRPQDCEVKALSWVLPQLQIIDFRGDFGAGLQELLRVWGIGLRRA